MDALDVLTGDHRAVEAIFDRYEAAATADERLNLKHSLVDNLVRHIVIEKHMFYPILTRVTARRGVSAPPPRQDVVVGMQQTLAVLPQTQPHGHSGTTDLMATLHRDFEFHRAFDEKHLHPVVHRALDQPAREELGRLLMEAKDIAPEMVGGGRVETQPTNLAIALGTFCDRVRDRLGERSPL